MLHYETLDVYKCSIQFVAFCVDVLDKLPRGHAKIADQLRRASHSIPLNIAEGSGKTSKKDKQRFRSIARGSAMECGAILDVMEVLKIVEPAEHRRGKALVVRIVQMLSKMCV